LQPPTNDEVAFLVVQLGRRDPRVEEVIREEADVKEFESSSWCWDDGWTTFCTINGTGDLMVLGPILNKIPSSEKYRVRAMNLQLLALI
jgi:hypothetical protein